MVNAHILQRRCFRLGIALVLPARRDTVDISDDDADADGDQDIPQSVSLSATLSESATERVYGSQGRAPLFRVLSNLASNMHNVQTPTVDNQNRVVVDLESGDDDEPASRGNTATDTIGPAPACSVRVLVWVGLHDLMNSLLLNININI